MVRMHTSGARSRAAGRGFQYKRWATAGCAVALAIAWLGAIGATAAQDDGPAAVPAERAEAVSAAPAPKPGPSEVDEDESLLADAIAMIEPFEGRRHRVYTDTTGHATIGVGFNLDRAGAEADLARLLPGVSYAALRRGATRLTDEQIDVLLRHDAQRALRVARREVEGFDDLPREVRLILIDMAYNLGSLRSWVRFRAALAAGDFDRAAEEMHDSRWRRQTGRRAAALIEKMRTIAG